MEDSWKYLQLPSQEGAGHSRGSSVASTPGATLLDKPLPSPGVLGRASIGAARLGYAQKNRLLQPLYWLPRGWRMTVYAGTGVAILVLISNVIILAWSFTLPHDPDTNFRIVREGSCAGSDRTFTLLHLVINVLSTLLLSTSNSAIQCLSAPTREAIDHAHAAGEYLDVGVSGLRNWRYMDKWRKWCWILLLASTLPLHLLYNSVFFATASANEYFAMYIPSNFLDIALPDPPVIPANADEEQKFEHLREFILRDMILQTREGKLTPTSNRDCIDIYNKRMVSEASNVLVVTKNINDTVPLVSYGVIPTRNSQGYSVRDSTQSLPTALWACGSSDSSCDLDTLAKNAEKWTIEAVLDNHAEDDFGTTVLEVDYCLIQKTDPHCTVQFIPVLMAIVIICNIVKIACFLNAVGIRSFRPLITLGDIMASFLDRPDLHTFNLGPISALDVREAQQRVRVHNIIRGQSTEKHILLESGGNGLKELPLRHGPWQKQQRRWFSGASRLRWVLTCLLMFGFWIFGGIVLPFAVRLEKDLSTQLQDGLGTVSPDSILPYTYGAGTIGNILLANAPQVLLSMIYLSYNGLLTCMLLSKEFTRFSYKRAGLRVSVPAGPNQQSSYWLSLPYMFALPLLTMSGLLHWALSQSIFFAEVIVRSPIGERDDEFSFRSLGFSSLGLLITLILGGVVCVSPFLLGWIRYSPDAPIVESNTLAISAACHRPSISRPEAAEHVKYGVIKHLWGNTVGLTADFVSPLAPGNRYTTRRELDLLTLHALSPAAIKLTPWQKAWEYVLWLLWISKLSAVILYSRLDFTDELAFIMTAALTGGFLLMWLVNAYYRNYKKRKMRHFSTYVAPEIIFCLLSVIPILAGSSRSYSARIWLTTSFFLSACIECWLWWQQHRVPCTIAQRHTISHPIAIPTVCANSEKKEFN